MKCSNMVSTLYKTLSGPDSRYYINNTKFVFLHINPRLANLERHFAPKKKKKNPLCVLNSPTPGYLNFQPIVWSPPPHSPTGSPQLSAQLEEVDCQSSVWEAARQNPICVGTGPCISPSTTLKGTSLFSVSPEPSVFMGR